MCLLVIAWQVHPLYRLIIAANRDEYHERPAAPLAKWMAQPSAGLPDAPARMAPQSSVEIVGGRDLRGGGTWLALDRLRRTGVVTNFRDLQPPQPQAPSRGQLILEYLAQPAGPGEFLPALQARAASYSGFNLLLSDSQSLWYASNRASPFARALPAGIYGLSNHLLDTAWPKLTRVRRRFQDWVDALPSPPAESLLEMLADRTPAETPPDSPRTGLSREWERVLSAPFVLHPQYGTRCSTLLLLSASGAVSVRERRFDAAGVATGETAITLNADQW